MSRRIAKALEIVLPYELIDEELRRRGWSWSALKAGKARSATGAVVDHETIQLYLMTRDPVIFAETLFKEHDTSGRWRFFDYQKESILYRGDTIHKCGAEVGKTREIVALLWWFLVCKQGDQLVGGDQDGTLEDIWQMFDYQRRNCPWLASQVDEKRTKLKPYKTVRAVNGNWATFRPAARRGQAFRGVHVRAAAYMDEAAKVHDSQAWSEFFRSLKPGCEARIYSVPDGVVTTKFERLASQAEPFHPGVYEARRPGYVLFSWAKPLMPSPFWDADRKATAIRDYGGVNAPGYQRNVLGKTGDPEMAVFPWDNLAPCLEFVEEYRIVRASADRGSGRVYMSVDELGPGYLAGRDETEVGTEPLTRLADFEIDLEELLADPVAVLGRWLEPVSGELVVGADLGYSAGEPTEIGVLEIDGDTRRLVARIRLERFDDDQQIPMIEAIDELFDRPVFGWGMDTGGKGRVVESLLKARKGASERGIRHDWAERLTGVLFEVPVVVIDEKGEELVDKSGKPKKVTGKEHATTLLELWINRGDLECPWDPELIGQITSHRYRRGAKGRLFDRENDHLVDLLRTAALRHELVTVREPDRDFVLHRPRRSAPPRSSIETFNRPRARGVKGRRKRRGREATGW